MAWHVQAAARFVRAAQKSYARKWHFLGLFGIVFLGSVALLARLDLLPSAPVAPQASLDASTVAHATSPAPTEPQLPVSISIPSISLSATVADPTTTNLDALDALLLSGAVRYPTSAALNENGNVVIFGHSSYLPIVKNQAYKTFDGVQKLTKGDTITVSSATTAYTYAVESVVKEDATEAAIPLSVSGRVLTLSTCDVFGQKSERFIVTATFVESHPLGA